MKIVKKGDVFIFRCKSCGRVFLEAATKTSFADEAVYVPEHETHGACMDCPDCGERVVGIREKDEKRKPEQDVKSND